MSPFFTKKPSLGPQKTLERLPKLFNDLQEQPFYVASTAVGGTWVGAHGKRDQRNGKPQNNHSPWALRHSQRPGYCGAFQPHARQALVWASVCTRNAAAFGSAFYCVGTTDPIWSLKVHTLQKGVFCVICLTGLRRVLCVKALGCPTKHTASARLC